MNSTSYIIEYTIGDEGWDCPRLCIPPTSVLQGESLEVWMPAMGGRFFDLTRALETLDKLKDKCPTYGSLVQRVADPRFPLDSPIQYRLTKVVETREVLDEQKIKLEQRRLDAACLIAAGIMAKDVKIIDGVLCVKQNGEYRPFSAKEFTDAEGLQ